MFVGRPRGLGRLAVAATAVAMCLLAGCGSSSSKVSYTTLKSRLAPASVAPGFQLQRVFDLADPIDLVGQGMRLPERTQPSRAVTVIRNAGFIVASGDALNQGGPMGATVTTGVVKFKSASGATQIRDWMHQQDLQEPCFSQCIYSTLNMPAPRVPNAVAARQVPNASAGPPPAVLAAIRAHKIPGPPPGGQIGPPTNYFGEFTVGPYLYFGYTQGGAPAQFLAGLKRYYDSVKSLH